MGGIRAFLCRIRAKSALFFRALYAMMHFCNIAESALNKGKLLKYGDILTDCAFFLDV